MQPRRALVIAIPLVLAAACGGKQPEPAKPAPIANAAPAAQPAPAALSVDEAGANAMALVDKLVKAIEDAGTDCPKMGQNLKGIIGDLKLAVTQEAELAKDPAKKAAFTEKYEPQLEAKLKDSLPKLAACIEDPEVKAFIQAMEA